MSDYWKDYDRIPAPRRRCENCSRGAMYDKAGARWPDVYVCSLDGGNKDYRFTCDGWQLKETSTAPRPA